MADRSRVKQKLHPANLFYRLTTYGNFGYYMLKEMENRSTVTVKEVKRKIWTSHRRGEAKMITIKTDVEGEPRAELSSKQNEDE